MKTVKANAIGWHFSNPYVAVTPKMIDYLIFREMIARRSTVHPQSDESVKRGTWQLVHLSFQPFTMNAGGLGIY